MRSALNILFGTAFAIATAWALGTLLFRKFAVSFHRGEQWLLSFIAGSACLGAMVLALGAMNMARKGVYLALGLLAIVWALIVWALSIGGPRPSVAPLPALQPKWKWLLIVVFSIASVFYFLQAIAPEPNPSDLTNRLSSMDQAHGFDRLHSFPDVAELPLLVAFAFGRHPAAALVNSTVLASLALLVLYCGRRIGHPLVGVFGALLVYASPVGTPAAALISLFYVLHFRDRQGVLPGPDVARRPRLAKVYSAIASSRWAAALKWLPWRAIIVASFLLWFARSGLTIYLTNDDVANMHDAWQKPMARIIQENFSVWSSGYRPLGALVYRLLFGWAGLHAAPYRILCYILMLLNCLLMYRVAARMATREVGWLVALLACYNAGFEDLYFNGGTIYDILCFTFYFLALDFYVRIRKNGLYLTPGGLVAFLLLYLCALNSKEMAVTLPPVLLGCELIFGKDWLPRTPEVRRAWIARWMPIALSGLMTIAFVFGRFSNSSPLTGNDGYRVHLGMQTYLSALAHYIGVLVSLPGLMGVRFAALLLVLLATIGLLARERSMIFALFFLMVAPLPVIFVALRGGYVMYIPAFGIALYLACLLVKIREALWTLLRWNTANPILPAATFLLCTLALIRVHGSHPLPVFHSQDFWVKNAVEQVAKAHLNIHEGSRILFLDDPIDKDQGMALISIVRLYYRTHDVTVDRVKSMPVKLDQAAMDSYDTLLHYDQTGIATVRR
jgi:hypothetical protein